MRKVAYTKSMLKRGTRKIPFVDQVPGSSTTLARNADLVVASSYLGIPTTAGNLSTGISTGRSYLNINNISRIRQGGKIHKVSFWLDPSATLLYKLIIQVWRKVGSTYNLIGQTEDIAAQCTIGIVNTIILQTDLFAQEGDMLAIFADDVNAVGRSIFTGINVGVTGSFRFLDTGTPFTTGTSWEGFSELGYIIPIQVHMQAPMCAIIGDSIAAGHPAHYSYIENSMTNNLASSISYQLTQLDSKMVCQNMGIGSQTTAQIQSRFLTDIVTLKPKIAIIEGGVNDIAGGRTQTQFLDSYTLMLNACRDNGIIPVVCKIDPWTNGSTTQMRTRDAWNTALQNLVATYAGSICIDFDLTLGEYDPTGDPGNLWNIKTSYNSDGVHFNTAGYTAKAAKINDEIKAIYTIT